MDEKKWWISHQISHVFFSDWWWYDVLQSCHVSNLEDRLQLHTFCPWPSSSWTYQPSKLLPLEAHCFMMSSESFMSWNLWQNDGWHSNSWYLKRCPPAEQEKSCPNQRMLDSMFVPGYFLNMDRVQSNKRLLSKKFEGISVIHSRSTKIWATESNPSALVQETVSGLCVRHYSDANTSFLYDTQIFLVELLLIQTTAFDKGFNWGVSICHLFWPRKIPERSENRSQNSAVGKFWVLPTYPPTWRCIDVHTHLEFYESPRPCVYEMATFVLNCSRKVTGGPLSVATKTLKWSVNLMLKPSFVSCGHTWNFVQGCFRFCFEVYADLLPSCFSV